MNGPKYLFIFVCYSFLLFNTYGSQQNDTITAYQYYVKGTDNLLKQNYTEAERYFTKSAEIYKNSNSLLYAYALFNISEIFKKTTKYPEGIEILKTIDISQFEKTSNPSLLYAEYFNRLGGLQISAGYFNDAKKNLNQALDKLKNQTRKFPEISFKIYNNLSICDEYLKDYQSSIQNLHKALSFKNFIRNIFNIVVVYQNIGKIYYQTGYIDSAQFYFSESELLIKKIKTDNLVQLANVYLNIGVFYKNIGQYNKAISYYVNAENLMVQAVGENNLSLNNLYTNIGNIYLLQGDYIRASEYFLKALNLIKSAKNQNYISLITILKNLAHTSFYSKDYDKGYEYLVESLEYYNKVKKTSKTEFHYNMFARYYQFKKNYPEARKYYLLHLDNLRNIYGENSPDIASAYLSYGQFLTSIDSFSEAEKILVKSLNLLQKFYGQSHTLTSQAYSSLGNLFLKHKKNTIALKYYISALKSLGFNISQPNSNEVFKLKSTNALLIINNLRKVSYLLILSGEKNLQSDDYLKALSMLKTSARLTDQLQSEYFNQESKLFLNAEQEFTLNMAIIVSIRLYEMTKEIKYLSDAFHFTERSKSAVLLSSLKDIQARIFSNVPENLTSKERKINEDISIYREMLSNEEQKFRPDTHLINIWQNKIFNLNKQKEELMAIYKKEYPAYFQSIFQENIISYKKLQSSLKRKQLLIEYYLNDTFLVCFFISKRNSSVFFHNIDSNFYRQVAELRFQLTNNKFDNFAYENYQKFVYSSHYLYNTLLGDCIFLQKYKNLIIIPDNVLAFIPFEVFLENQTTKEGAPDYRKLEYLIKKYNIVYSYSSSLAFLKISNNQKRGKSVLAFAPSYEEYQKKGTDNLPGDEINPNLFIPLKGVEKEVDNIQKIADVDILKDEKATETAFKENASNYPILHLAMHAFVDNENPQFSKLIFSRLKDDKNDGFLNTYELYNLKLNSRLVVLSACNTGYGKVRKGEGVMSLARGFLYAGCLNIVMTLWPLEDQSGVAIMTDFYKNLYRGNDPGKSLHKAKLTYLEQADKLKSHPYFWATYVAVVNQSSFHLTKLVQYLLIIILSFVSLIFAYFQLRKKKNAISAS